MSSNHNIQTSFLILISLQIFVPHVRSQSSPPPGYQYPDFNPSIITIIVILVAALFLMALFTIYVRRQSTDANFSIRRVLSTRRPTAARGLDPSVIDTFPTFVYSTVKPLKIGKGALECAVCLNEYEDEETLRLIPKCDHVFHPECIDAWLQSHVTCPVCRANLAVVPGEQNDDVSENNVVVNIQEQGTGIESLDRDLDRNESVKLNESSIIPRVFEGFRSHSTGHSLVQPGENMERFTLRLPADVRKQVVNRALLNRMGGEGSGKKGYRTGGAISGRRKGFKRLESLDRVVVRSERWVLSRAPSFLSRALSFRSPRVATGNAEASTSSMTPKAVDKIPLNNLGPKSC